jgi:hypothetical protein
LPSRGIRALTAVAALLAFAFAGWPASAAAQFSPWDGENPFNCVLQNAGTGTTVPDPGADPYCVEFDKTNQNVTDFGIVDFLANEPARVAAASPKCFYFQHDHWTGSIIQGTQTEIWHWDGSYYFDKAKGNGGVSVHNFRIGGQSGDPTPFVPPAYQPYFYPEGGGGVIIENNVPADPNCVALASRQAAQIYKHCLPSGWIVDVRGVGDIGIGDRRHNVLDRLGPPRSSTSKIDRFCVNGGGEVLVRYRKGTRVILVKTTAAGHSVGSVHPGDSAASARALGMKRVRRNLLVANKGRVLIGLGGGKVSYLASADRKRLHQIRKVRRALRRTR